MKSYYNDKEFDYLTYKESQIRKNKAKINTIWVKDVELDLIISNVKGVKSGICHGVRNYYEVDYFRNKLGGEWIGTDISETVLEYGGIVHDFNEPLDMKFDLVYTNSIDHAYSFKATFNNLLAQSIKYFALHLDLDHHKIDEADCLSINETEIKKMLKKRNLKYRVISIWRHRPIYLIRK